MDYDLNPQKKRWAIKYGGKDVVWLTQTVTNACVTDVSESRETTEIPLPSTCYTAPLALWAPSLQDQKSC